MEQAGDRDTLRCDRVVELSGFACFEYVVHHAVIISGPAADARGIGGTYTPATFVWRVVSTAAPTPGDAFRMEASFISNGVTMRVLHSFVVGSLFGAAAVSTAFSLAQSETDPVKLSPQYYTVRIDNDRLRVVEYRLGPGQKEPKHSHPPGIVYSLSDAKMKIETFPDGVVATHDYHAGDLVWRDAVTHAAENVGSTEAHVIAVELKECNR